VLAEFDDLGDVLVGELLDFFQSALLLALGNLLLLERLLELVDGRVERLHREQRELRPGRVTGSGATTSGTAIRQPAIWFRLMAFLTRPAPQDAKTQSAVGV
jgi:hypothetical protein